MKKLNIIFALLLSQSALAQNPIHPDLVPTIENDKLADVPENTIKARVGSGSGDPEDITIGSLPQIVTPASDDFSLCVEGSSGNLSKCTAQDNAVTNLDDHNHIGGDGGAISHTGLINVAINAHHTPPTAVSQLANDSGYLSSEVDGSTTNEIQSLSISGDVISLSGDPATIDLNPYLDDTDTDTGIFQGSGTMPNSPVIATLQGSIFEFQSSANASGLLSIVDGAGAHIAGDSANPSVIFANQSDIELNFGAGGDLKLDSSAGTSGQVLTSGGANNAPSWTTVSGGGGGSAHSDGANCPAGSYPLGVDQNGSVQGCTVDVDTNTNSETNCGNNLTLLGNGSCIGVTNDFSTQIGFQEITYQARDSGSNFITGNSFTIPSATDSSAGLLGLNDKQKLDAVEVGATSDQTNSEIETAYNSRVSQVSSSEKTLGTESSVRRFSPVDVKDMIGSHSSGGGSSQSYVIQFGGEFLADPNEINGTGVRGLFDDRHASDLGDVGAATLASTSGGISFPFDVEIKRFYTWHRNSATTLTGAWGWVLAKQSKTNASNTVTTAFLLDESSVRSGVNNGSGLRDYDDTVTRLTDFDFSADANRTLTAGDVLVIAIGSPTANGTNAYVQTMSGYIEFTKL